MNRRKFLLQSAYWMIGSSLGLNFISRSIANASQIGTTVPHPRIALIIDDFGYSKSQVKRFLSLNVPITFSVLPHLKFSETITHQIHEAGHDVMLHQPMEPYNSSLNPGPGSLYVGSSLKEITRILNENISNIPFAVGVNNHMGSKFTSRNKEMNQTLGVIKDNNLFFIDSLTSYHSVGYRTAKNFDISFARRNYFLDNVPEEAAILFQLAKLKRYAQKYGTAIAIGHPYRATARSIRRFSKHLTESNISLVHVSKLFST